MLKDTILFLECPYPADIFRYSDFSISKLFVY